VNFSHIWWCHVAFVVVVMAKNVYILEICGILLYQKGNKARNIHIHVPIKQIITKT
jgi:hypothetical protein